MTLVRDPERRDRVMEQASRSVALKSSGDFDAQMLSIFDAIRWQCRLRETGPVKSASASTWEIPVDAKCHLILPLEASRAALAMLHVAAAVW